jgi:hypothetical protein
MGSKLYETNIKKAAVLLLPSFLRKPAIVAFVQAIVAPVAALKVDFLAFRRDITFRIEHNGQVCRLRGALNDLYDPVERRIIIADGMKMRWATVYWRDTSPQFYLPDIVGRRGFGLADYDFVVQVPAELLPGKEAQLRATVNAFKLASKTYIITNI